MIKIRINDKTYQAKEGETVLSVCQRNGIKIPTLCHFEGLPKEQICRLCLVETNKHSKLMTSCALLAEEGLEIQTETEKVQRARKINLELLWSDHAGKCSSCYKNRNCELQKLAEEYKIENFHFVPRKDEITKEEELDLLKNNNLRDSVDTKNPCIEKRGSLCVECRRCINICPIQEFGFNFRAGQVKVGKFSGESLDCIFCGKCVEICPTASLVPKSNFEKIKKNLDNPRKMNIAIVDEDIFQNQEKGEFLGLLHKIGFEKIFSLKDAQEEFDKRADDFISNLNEDYIFSSKNLSFNLYIKKYYPKFEKNLIKADFPEIIMKNWLKSDWVKNEKINSQDISLVFVTSQLAKKKLEKEKDVDFVLFFSEVERLGRYLEISEVEKKANFDYPFSGRKESARNKFVKICGKDKIEETLEKIETKKLPKGVYEFYF